MPLLTVHKHNVLWYFRSSRRRALRWQTAFWDSAPYGLLEAGYTVASEERTASTVPTGLRLNTPLKRLSTSTRLHPRRLSSSERTVIMNNKYKLICWRKPHLQAIAKPATVHKKVSRPTPVQCVHIWNEHILSLFPFWNEFQRCLFYFMFLMERNFNQKCVNKRDKVKY
jgi:hypothetical protein